MTVLTSAERRAARRQRRVQSPFAQLPFGHIQNHFAPLEVITPEQIEQLHEASMHILEEIGITFMDAEALDLWEKAGAKVDHSRQHVWFDRGLILDLVAKAPAQFRWRARNPERDRIIGGNYINFVPHGGVIFAQDMDKGRRPGTLEDYYNFLRLAQSNPLMHFTGDQLVVPHDVRVSYRHLHRFLWRLYAFGQSLHGSAPRSYYCWRRCPNGQHCLWHRCYQTAGACLGWHYQLEQPSAL